MNITRRKFLQAVGATGVAAGLGACASLPRGAGKAHVVVVGGGSGGATAAKYLRQFGDLPVTLIEPDATYHTCYGSNWVIGGLRDIDGIAQSYDNLSSKHGVRVVQGLVTGIDADVRSVTLDSGDKLSYDRLVVSPGIDWRWETAADGASEAIFDTIPHAWKAGPQTSLLRSQLEAMPDGGVFIMVVPGNPFRCPPGPYERASLIADYFKREKPRSKIIILDAKENFSKQGLFVEGWQANFGDMIEWVPGSKGGMVEAIDVAGKTALSNSGFNEFKADVLNYIPPQQAGRIAQDAGLTNDLGWCPVDQRTFESTLQAGIYVIGDACIAGAMPKSGHSANSQGKMVAAAIVNDLSGLPPIEPSMANTCYSLVTPDWGISVAAVYRFQGDSIKDVEGAGGVSPSGASADFRRQEAAYTRGWYASITNDIWG